MSNAHDLVVNDKTRSSVDLHQISLTDIILVASWLTHPDNFKWLEIDPDAAARPTFLLSARTHRVRLFSLPGEPERLGLVALSNLNLHNRTGLLWTVLGNRQYAGRGLTSSATYDFLRSAFAELHLRSVYTWCVESNKATQRMCWKHGFCFIGRQRSCHFIDDHFEDRLWYDLLPDELTAKTGPIAR